MKAKPLNPTKRTATCLDESIVLVQAEHTCHALLIYQLIANLSALLLITRSKKKTVQMASTLIVVAAALILLHGKALPPHP